MILTLVETDLEGAATEVSLEALSFARDISAAGNGVPVDAVVFGDLSDDLRGELAAYGVRTIHHVVGDDVAAYSGAGWASAIQQVRDAAGSVVVMAAGTDRGTELMAHVATRSGAAMAANVLSFSGLAPFVVTRQVVGGSAMEEMNLHQRPAVFTVAGHAVEAKPADTEGAGEVVEHTPTIAPEDLVARVQSVAEVQADDESGALTSAKVVVGAGRGVGGPDKFDDVTESPTSCTAPSASRAWSPAPAGVLTTSRWARPAPGSRRTSTSPAASAAPSSTGPAAPRPRPSSPSTPTPRPPWSPARRTPSSATSTRSCPRSTRRSASAVTGADAPTFVAPTSPSRTQPRTVPARAHSGCALPPRHLQQADV